MGSAYSEYDTAQSNAHANTNMSKLPREEKVSPAVSPILVDPHASIAKCKQEIEGNTHPSIPANEQLLYKTAERDKVPDNALDDNSRTLYKYGIHDGDYIYLGGPTVWKPPAGDDGYPIYVECPDGRTLTLNVTDKDDIEYTKLQIQTLTNGTYPVGAQRLWFKNPSTGVPKELTEDTATLKQENIRKGAVLKLGPIPISVETREGKIFSLMVSPYEYVQSVKRVIEDKTKERGPAYPVDEQQLHNKANVSPAASPAVSPREEKDALLLQAQESPSLSCHTSQTWTCKTAQRPTTQTGIVKIDAMRSERVSMQGTVCVLADVEVCKHCKWFFWDVFVEKMSNRCWVGIVPGPISAYDWNSNEFIPSNGFGIESTYGTIYNGTNKSECIGAPKSKDTFRFKLNVESECFYVRINDGEVFRLCSGHQIPKIACLAIVNNTGRGKFIIRRGTEY